MTGPARRLLLAGLAAMALAVPAGAWLAGARLPSGDAATVPGGTPAENYPAEAPPTRLGPTDPREPVQFTVVLELPGRTAMQRFLAALDDPASPDFHRYIDATEFGRRYGLPEATIDRVSAWLAGGGLEITSRHPQRTGLGARGRAAQVNALLDVRLVDHVTADGVRFHAPVGRPAIPAELRGAVAGVTGLDSRPLFRPLLRGPLAAVPQGGMKPADVARAFDIAPLWEAGIDGSGQTVAILSLDGFADADVEAFEGATGVDGPPIERVRVPDGGPLPPGKDSLEVNLDIDIVRGIAPGARIISYEADTGIFGDIINRIVADGMADIVSISWGGCEAALSADDPYLRFTADAFAAAAAKGISIFAASGDSGVYGCRHGDHANLALSADFPANHPSVIGVGGTYLSVRTDGTYLEEAGWEEPLSGGGTGGGLSTWYERPDWQAGPGVDKGDNPDGRRQIPDVAGPADCDSAFFVVATTPDGVQRAGPMGCGTSAAAPFWAGSMALVRQLAEREGIDGLGSLAPTLYRLAANYPPNTIFHDVIRGGNLLHPATPGWDYATGLGSPRVHALGVAIIEYLKANR